MAITRKRMHVVMIMSDSSKLEGTLIIEGYTRLSDVINNKSKDFLVLLDFNTQVHIVNKQHIIQIMEMGEMD
ncbi:hypothetical protein THII_1877 [Thioploca ingrica]|uniref:Uncharacterized protein n=1 Tax=Thioploca ingrica TaxID=40754 RepID=A0A090AG96_9GAMM|nr:hypothetical protein THII_1877 [Thioploca ingrica]